MATGEWIEWKGGARPQDFDVPVEIQFRGPKYDSDRPASEGLAGDYYWCHLDCAPNDDIIAYRIR
ncbi:hypothetical protein [Companilactobacillus sp.]|uniref:hypothetical protein n=1 Tax=Companilactobacillus sp. TaxID=2767905 RepID=UPI002619A0F1|nr:hypothetical protein [Companilactobacillus sp.]